MSRFDFFPASLEEANEYIARHHRHRGPVRGFKFAIACFDNSAEKIVGIGVVGRPSSRVLQDGLTLEITRVATDGTKDATSALYGRLTKAALALGFKTVVTYNLQTESGSSLKAAGFKVVGEARAKTWHTPSRPRVDTRPLQHKLRWELRA